MAGLCIIEVETFSNYSGGSMKLSGLSGKVGFRNGGFQECPVNTDMIRGVRYYSIMLPN